MPDVRRLRLHAVSPRLWRSLPLPPSAASRGPPAVPPSTSAALPPPTAMPLRAPPPRCPPLRRSKDEMYRHLSVDVAEDSAGPGAWTASRGLVRFFRPERRDLKCEKCDAGITVTQTSEILSR